VVQAFIIALVVHADADSLGNPGRAGARRRI